MDYSYYNEPRSQPYSLYGLPTPNQQPPQDEAFAPLNNFNQNFPGFDPSFRLDPSQSFVPPPHSPPESFTKHSESSDANNQHTDPISFDGDESNLADPLRSSSEEKDSVPAQSKRKAQNRAAQRAFRERKERHVKDLEDKVNNLETASDTLHADNERLKRELAKYTTENEILRATSNTNRAHGNINESPEPTVTGPMRYSPTDFYTSLVPDGPALPRSPQHRVTVCQITGEKLLDAGATWDLIQGHELFKRGQVDIANVTEILKGMAQCDGQGPAYKEGQVRRAIEESAAMDRDELI
ncbi:unnamed protein product [Penicillium salamii]|nr:unnamed protein product [Penicillium salamii]